MVFNHRGLSTPQYKGDHMSFWAANVSHVVPRTDHARVARDGMIIQVQKSVLKLHNHTGS